MNYILVINVIVLGLWLLGMSYKLHANELHKFPVVTPSNCLVNYDPKKYV